MATSQDRNLMLSVKDFGPIYNAEIELRPLTVFVGPSNTGKSYLAILIYALHKFFNNRRTTRYSYFHRRRSALKMLESSEEDITRVVAEAEQIIAQVKMDRLTEVFSLPDEIASLIRPLFNDVFSEDDLADEIMRCFGVDELRRLIRYGRNRSAKVSLFSEISDLPEASYNNIPLYKFDIDKGTLNASISDTAPLQIGRDAIEEYIQITSAIERRFEPERPNSNQKRLLANALIDELFDNSFSYFANPMSRPAYYLPADRAGVMHAHKVVVGSLIQSASRAGLRPERALPELSGVLADFLEQLFDLGDLAASRRKKLHRNLALRLENEILSGSIRAENSETGYPLFFYQPTGWKEDIPLMNTSSMVSELAPIVLYLRQVVSPGEVLIIEEPEAHLHPGMQVAFIRHLAEVVHAGIRVIITTHSEWVLEELANLIRMSDLPKSRRKGIGGADYALNPNQVGIWLFESKKRPKGSVVREINIDPDEGGLVTDYIKTANDLYNRWATIGNRIVEREHE